MIETETKFRVPDAGCLRRLGELQAVGPFRVIGRRTVAQRDEYWDTPERSAAAAHVSVRLREVSGERLFTVKCGAVVEGQARRVEIEEPAGEGELRGWLGALAAAGRVDLPFDPGRLEAVLEIRNRRSILELAAPDARAALCLDEVLFRGPRGETGDREAELELEAGGEARLAEAAAWLRDRFALEPARESKYQRALAAVG